VPSRNSTSSISSPLCVQMMAYYPDLRLLRGTRSSSSEKNSLRRETPEAQCWQGAIREWQGGGGSRKVSGRSSYLHTPLTDASIHHLVKDSSCQRFNHIIPGLRGREDTAPRAKRRD
jgi:hypothetical protein